MNGLTGFSFSWVQGLSKTAIKVLAGLHSLLEIRVEKIYFQLSQVIGRIFVFIYVSGSFSIFVGYQPEAPLSS